jgi:catechol 2,3-dioxygenase-like lactoylglutathione lyase family enzyme
MADRLVVTRLSHACLGSSDLARTIGFYCNLFGCTIAHEFRTDAGELYGVFLDCHNGTFLEFFKQEAAMGQEGLFRHLCLQVEDITAAAESLRSAGLDPEIRRGRTDRVLQCFVQDPDGTRIELQQHDEQSVLYPLIYGRGAGRG